MISNCEECGKKAVPVCTVIRGDCAEDVCIKCADKLGLLSGVKAIDDLFEKPPEKKPEARK